VVLEGRRCHEQRVQHYPEQGETPETIQALNHLCR
jgi:hypothetical protein